MVNKLEPAVIASGSLSPKNSAKENAVSLNTVDIDQPQSIEISNSGASSERMAADDLPQTNSENCVLDLKPRHVANTSTVLEGLKNGSRKREVFKFSDYRLTNRESTGLNGNFQLNSRKNVSTEQRTLCGLYSKRNDKDSNTHITECANEILNEEPSSSAGSSGTKTSKIDTDKDFQRTSFFSTSTVEQNYLASSSSHQNCSEIKCAICREDKTNDVIESMPCNHSFHSKCIKLWFAYKNCCPLCRTRLVLISHPAKIEIPDSVTRTYEDYFSFFMREEIQ